MAGTNFSNKKVEHELTFLARYIPPEIADVEPLRVIDTYFPPDPDVHARLRVRRQNDRYMIHKKVPRPGAGAFSLDEYNVPLDEAEYESLILGNTRQIIKDRYPTTINGYPADVDVFLGRLKGLVMIDFESVEEYVDFQPPECCGAEVKQEEFLAGGVLSASSYEDISRQLGRLGYLRLDVPEWLQR
jgi:adenylate cyclase